MKKSINRDENIQWEKFGRKGSLRQRCTENHSQTPWEIPMSQLADKVKADKAFLKINSFKNVYE